MDQEICTATATPIEVKSEMPAPEARPLRNVI